jgi:hypothetical protein
MRRAESSAAKKCEAKSLPTMKTNMRNAARTPASCS